MTDIFIKSYNRVFYLDRCISSITKMVSGDYKITILDDGTPEKYLDKIQEKYSKVEIKFSEKYLEKSKNVITEQKNRWRGGVGMQIPTQLWKNSVKNASEYFIITEDDVWFTDKINLDELSLKAKKHRISLIKLGWLGNFRDDQWIDLKSIDDQLTTTYPKNLFLSHPIIMDLFFHNRFKFFSLAYRLGFFDNYTKLKYWTLNSILMGFWHRDYWLSVWKKAPEKVNETLQLKNAANYYRKHRNNPHFVARTKNEILKTTFQSSASNAYHEYGYDVNIHYINHLLNEHWYNGNFNSLQNFPKDFSLDYVEEFFDENIKKIEFRKWVEQFKNQYRNLGCTIE